MNTVDKVGALVGGRYRLLELAGQGGMAEVWRAELIGAAGFKRPVAIKRVLSHLLDAGDFRAMFVEEARVGALIGHPNVVQVFDFGEDESGLYLAMEWVDGVTLRELCDADVAAGRRADPALGAAIGVELLRALDASHGHRVFDDGGPEGRATPIVHRDVTPSNVLISMQGVVKLADFGLARAFDRARMTPDGIVKGKIAYLAPEQLRGAETATAADIYAVGVVLWELIAGHRLHQGRSDSEIVRRLMDRVAHPSLRDARDDVPSELGDAIDRAIAIEPERRHPSASAFGRELRRVLRAVEPERAEAATLRDAVVATRAARAAASGTHAVEPEEIPVEYSDGSAAAAHCEAGGPLDAAKRAAS